MQLAGNPAQAAGLAATPAHLALVGISPPGRAALPPGVCCCGTQFLGAGGVWCHPSGGGRVAAISSASLFEDAWLDQPGNCVLADWCFNFLAAVSPLLARLHAHKARGAGSPLAGTTAWLRC